ncbi:MAG: phosphate ABC transporter permease subunit PstC [Tissierellia bacterium]|jgi:phosphate transport system permease protein|nr:phosphate ABC transporter permease subunit PstC [Tissierellia bacterium]
MRSLGEKIFESIIKIISLFSVLLLVFIVVFIFKESLIFFNRVSIVDFIIGRKWNPLGAAEDLSIWPIILGTVYVSIVAILIAMPIGVGTAIVLSTYTSNRIKKAIRGGIDVLAGIPSVVYGFIGLLVVVKFLEINLSLAAGESVLAGGIVLSVMVLPFIISTCDESMEKIYEKYSQSSSALGVSKSYLIRNIILPESKRSILASMVLALGRGMGETMAVMMVIGNAPIMPKLLGKTQTIPSLITLEMGMAEVGSLHYHALFASGFVLMLILLGINALLYFIKSRINV